MLCRFHSQNGVHKMRITTAKQLDKVLARSAQAADRLNLPIHVGDMSDLREVLAAGTPGLEVVVNLDRVVLTGVAYFVKTFLKQLGFKWDRDDHEWYMPRDEATPDVAVSLKELCEEWGLALTGDFHATA